LGGDSLYQKLIQAQKEIGALNRGLEERVRERTPDLGRANDEIQRFAYIVTHDLRAPLVNIMGFTSELEESLKAIQSVFQTSDSASAVSQKDGPAEEARTAVLEDLPEAIELHQIVNSEDGRTYQRHLKAFTRRAPGIDAGNASVGCPFKERWVTYHI
jgi:signal transduction histidine kinase